MSLVESTRLESVPGSFQIAAVRAALRAQAEAPPPGRAAAVEARPAAPGVFARARVRAAAAFAPRPSRAAGARRRAATFRDLLAVRAVRRAVNGLSLAALVWVALHLVFPPAADPSDLREPHRFWTEVTKPFRFYEIASVDLGEPAAYEARQTRFGGGRRDTIVYGGFGADETHLRIEFYRVGVEEAPVAHFETEVARRAAEVGASARRTGPVGALATRLGAFETADFDLEGASGARACLGFRLHARDPAFRVSGYGCGSAKRGMDRRMLACALDRIELLSAGQDTALRDFFRAAEEARKSDCQPLRNARAPTWLDPAGAPPALRASPVKKK